MPEPVGVLIVDDHVVIAEGLSVLIAAAPDLAVAGIAHTARDGLRLAAEIRPQVILLDHFLPDRRGVDITSELKTISPSTAVVILTSEDDDDVLARAFEAGAAGYLLKTQAAARVIDAIRAAAAGEMLVSEGTLARLLRNQRVRAARTAATSELTERELDVLKALGEGLDSGDIAERLGLTVSTVRTYVQVILRKLDAHSRLQAVMRAHEQGLL